MLFNSFVFFASFVILYLIYWNAPTRFRKTILLIASFLFYMYWSVGFFIHFLVVVLINYALFEKILNKHNKKILWVAICFNLCNLIVFKYTHAFLEVLGPIYGNPFFTQHYYYTNIVLPLAISFYSFQIIALHIDAFRQEIHATEKIQISDYTLFIFFFPQLIAGPIMRHTDFFKQINRARLTEHKIFSGLFLILFGIIKKSYVADGIAVVIDPIFANPNDFNTISNLTAAIGFALQLYLDFSGYTDMARGVANLLGYRIPENFRGPYFSTSFSEHWRRWHITLSTWLRDYLYIPLGGNKSGKLRTNLNLLLTMSLGGLWHGHNLTYLIWGIMEGTYLAIERALGLHRKQWQSWASKGGAMLFVFSGSVIARIFFRADSSENALAMIYNLFVWNQVSIQVDGLNACWKLIIVGILLHTIQYYRPWFKVHLLKYRYLVLPPLSILTLFLLSRVEHAGAAFIYFQF